MGNAMTYTADKDGVILKGDQPVPPNEIVKVLNEAEKLRAELQRLQAEQQPRTRESATPIQKVDMHDWT